MCPEALKTIKNLRWSLSRPRCKKEAKMFLKLISFKYPNGLMSNDESSEENNSRDTLRLNKDSYFVMPGFEHVTKNQPIARFNNIDLVWELDSITNYYN